jgi:hypothetical protein
LDFFQYLNYARYGVTASDSAHIATTLSIGAALIDQYDPNIDAYIDNAGAKGNLAQGTTTTEVDYTGGTGKAFGMENFDANKNNGATTPPSGYYCLNRPFRNVGEFGYSYNGDPVSPTTLDFKDPPPPIGTNADAALLDFFTYNSANPRSGVVSLNTRQAPVLAAILMSAIANDGTGPSGGPSPSPTPATVIRGGTTQGATAAANAIVNETSNTGVGHGPALSRADIARFVSVVSTQSVSLYSTDPLTKETRETIARALAEVGQTRTWGLLIDLVAQTGHYAPTAQGLADFAVDGEKRYWLHVAIDRFDGTVVGQQLEEVTE